MQVDSIPDSRGLRPRETTAHQLAICAIALAAVLSVLPASPTHGGAGPTVDLHLVATLDDQVVDIVNSGVAADNRLFLARKAGVIEIYQPGGVLGTPFLDINSIVFGDILPSNDERGLLGIAFHPDYDSNGFFYVNYINNSGDTVVARYTVSGADPNVADSGSAVQVLAIDQPASNHNGGQLQFGPDDFLYIAVGDGGGGCDSAGSGCNAQKTLSLLGTIVRIDVDGDDFPMDANRNYAIPMGNPFTLDAAVADETWAYGLRNPWRFSFDRTTGDMYIGDVGQSRSTRREEINRQEAASLGGENYGWPVAEGDQCGPGTCGLGDCPTPTPSCGSLTFPLYDYATGCSVTGGFVYRGSAIPEIAGRYVFGDYCSGDIIALHTTTLDDPKIVDAGFGLTTFGEDIDGELYVAVDDEMYKIVPEGAPTATPTVPPTTTPTASPTSTALGGGTLDVDGDGTVLAATDGTYVFRALLGLQFVVPPEFRLLDDSIAEDQDIAAAVTLLGDSLDVDENGSVQGATDGVYVYRHLQGLQFVVPTAFRDLDPGIPSDDTIAGNVDALLP